MARLGASKKKKNPRATELSELKKKFKRVTEQLESRDREQTATSEILRVIASSPTDLQPVLDVVAENAARLCNASDALIVRVDGNNHIPMASYGVLAPTHGIPTNPESPAGRAILDRQTIHIRDLAREVDDATIALSRTTRCPWRRTTERFALELREFLWRGARPAEKPYWGGRRSTFRT
jgi:hypothetical protein